jgi:hypothetical protein
VSNTLHYVYCNPAYVRYYGEFVKIMLSHGDLQKLRGF